MPTGKGCTTGKTMTIDNTGTSSMSPAVMSREDHTAPRAVTTIRSRMAATARINLPLYANTNQASHNSAGMHHHHHPHSPSLPITPPLGITLTHRVRPAPPAPLLLLLQDPTTILTIIIPVVRIHPRTPLGSGRHVSARPHCSPPGAARCQRRTR
jgi:hypothetical protein